MLLYSYMIHIIVKAHCFRYIYRIFMAHQVYNIISL